jgi:hypothetical protein
MHTPAVLVVVMMMALVEGREAAELRVLKNAQPAISRGRASATFGLV